MKYSLLLVLCLVAVFNFSLAGETCECMANAPEDVSLCEGHGFIVSICATLKFCHWGPYFDAKCQKEAIANNATGSALAQVAEPNLTYYHRYEKNHGEKINENIPLHQHYTNERHLRQHANKIKDDISREVHQSGFKTRAIHHEIVSLENNVDKTRAKRNAIFRMAEQRENSIKEEINHAEKFRELYEQRLKKNMGREGTALPDQEVALEKLVGFDKQRAEHWKLAEDKQQKLLRHTTEKDLKAGIAAEKGVAGLQAKIAMLKAEVQAMQQKSAFRVARLTENLKNLEGTINQDIALDKKRANNEVKESTLAKSSVVAAESTL